MTGARTKGWIATAILVAALTFGPPCVSAQESPAPPEAPPAGTPPPPAPAPAQPKPPTWDFKLGLSYLATTGNTDTSSSGVDAAYRQDWGLWSIEATAAAVRATRNGVKTAESFNTQMRGRRRIAENAHATLGLRGERNRFAGIDLRTITDMSLSWTMLDAPAWRIQTLWGLSGTREEPLGDRPVHTSIGGLLQLQSTGKLSEGAEFSSQVTVYPDLKEASDYRIDANLALQATLNRHLALRLGYDLKYDNVPVPGFQRTDTTTTASLVVQLGRAARK